jgi:hypothetical protein
MFNEQLLNLLKDTKIINKISYCICYYYFPYTSFTANIIYNYLKRK